MLLVEVCGLLSSVLISIMFVPQVVHTCRTRDAEGLSYSFLFMNLLASTMGLVYSVYFRVVPMMIANTSATLFSLILIPLKLLPPPVHDVHDVVDVRIARQ